jgi:hypothetical protein
MIRTLLIISAAAFVASVATLAAAVAVVGPDAAAHGALSFGPGGWGSGPWRIGFSDDRDDEEEKGDAVKTSTEEGSRDIAWSGGEALSIDLPAEVRYVQADGAPKITVSGPRALIDAVTLEDGAIRLDHDLDLERPLLIKISAPGVKRFTLESSGRLSVDGYKQDKLDLEISGSGEVSVAGAADALKLTVSGSGGADLSALKLKTARVEIDGSGGARLRPSDSAEVEISGSGVARLLNRPPRLESRVSGSGRVVEADGG